MASVKKGAGSSIMDYAIKRLGEDSPYYMENSNEINNSFYTKFGFSEVYTNSIKGSYHNLAAFSVPSNAPPPSQCKKLTIYIFKYLTS
jgi:hypothetical protein